MSPRSLSVSRLFGVSFGLSLAFGLALLPSSRQVSRGAEAEASVLTSRPRLAPQAEHPLPVGEEVRTAMQQRRRVSLGAGFLLYVGEGTRVQRSGEQHLTLDTGAIFVEATGAGDEPFVIKTPDRKLTLHGGRCSIVTGKRGTDIVVASGQVRVEGHDKPLRAGQRLAYKAERATPAERVSHETAWMRDLMTASETPLVPASHYAGGRLIVRDPDGQEAQLRLRKYHIDVHSEDGFARTTLDETYFNDANTRLEGTFYFPLPPDASLSRLAMYVDGQLMEGGMAERDYARQVYERILYQQRDPALLEWLDGSTFKMRVFPLEPRQEKRLILSYTQKLPTLYGQVSYRFPTGHTLGEVRDWSFHARVKNGNGLAWHCSSHTLQSQSEGDDLLLSAQAKNVRLQGDVVLSWGGGSTASPAYVRFKTAEHDGAKYLLLRYAPTLPSHGERQRRDWVFLFESSGDRDPLLARTQIEIVRNLLLNAERDDTFTVLTANTRVRAWQPQPQPVTPANVQAAIAFLEKAHLIGALDLGRAFHEAQTHLQAVKDPYLVHIGSGIAAMGERRNDVLAKRLPEGTHYVGVSVGKRWNRALMKQAAERSAGYFTQINPDEPLSWRVFELSATLNTPRLLDVSVTDKTGQATFLPFACSLAQGEEIVAIARFEKDMPQTVVVRGKLDGRAFEKELAVEKVAEKADYLPRCWAKLEIERLLTEDALKNKKRIVELSKAMYVMTPFTSLLVLENEEMYQQYKVDRGRKDHWAMYPCPQKIPVVYEPEDGQSGDPKKGIKPSARQVRKTILVRERPSVRKTAHVPQEEAAMRGFVVNVQVQGGEANANQRRPSTFAATPMEFEIDKAPKGETFIRAMHDVEREAMPLVNAPPTLSKIPGLKRVFGTIDSEAEAIPASELAPHPQREAMRTLGVTYLSRSTVKAIELGDVQGDVGSLALLPPNRAMEPEERIRNILREEARPHSLLYQRPSYSGDDRLFYDLVSYAPGLNTSEADIHAAIEADAAPQRKSKIGTISDIAGRLLDKVHAVGWHSYTMPQSGEMSFHVVFDGRGRYVWERTLPIGLRERVVCDGTTLWHLYPDLGLASQRGVSRFHCREAERWIPWLLPSREELTRDADVVGDGERTLAVEPHARLRDGKAQPYIRTRYLLDAEYRVVERQYLQMPSAKLLYRAVSPSRSPAPPGNALPARLRLASPPELRPDTSKFVVLSLPYRTREHILKTRKIEDNDYTRLRFEDGLALLAADFAAGNGEIVNVFQRCFAERDRRPLGLYVLLAACGQNLDSEHLDVLAHHPHEPLAQYLALHSSPVLRKHASQWAVGSNPWGDGYLQRLALAHALLQRWQNGRALVGSAAQQQAERERAVAYVRANKGSAFAWALLGLMQDRARDEEQHKQDARPLHRALAEAYRLFADIPRFTSSARYEEARNLFKNGQAKAARKAFRALYEQTRKEDRLPLFDADFRAALLDDGVWSELMRQTATDWIAQKHRAAVLTLAEQCWQVDDRPLANHLLALALDDLSDGKERLTLRLAALSYLWESGQYARMDELLRSLLEEPKTPHKASLWRLAEKLAERRKMPVRAMECLEQALALEYDHLPEIINLRQVRQDYESLLRHYQRQAEALISLKVSEPVGFRAKVIRTADHWRALDREANEACRLAADILHTLGERELTWDYLTTPVALRPNEAEPWLNLAQALNHRGELTLADRAYRAAFESEPTNAQILWDRAANLRQSGQTARARELYHQLADSEWQPRFASLRTQARWELEKR